MLSCDSAFVAVIDCSSNKDFASHSGSTNHSSISAEESEGSIRLPVGLQDAENLKADPDQALGRG